MRLLCIFGVGSKKILAKKCSTPGTVTDVSGCWWLTINTKPLRRYPGGGALHPSIITFVYRVDNIPYTGKRYIPIRYQVPQKGESISVYYDPANPRQYACYAFGSTIP